MPDETSGPSPVPVDGPGGLTGCTEEREEAEDGCSYVLSCDYFAVSSECRVTEDGTWACDCAGPVIISEQTMPAVGVSQACENSATFCTQIMAGVWSSFECTDTTTTVDGDGCTAASECVRTTRFADGTVATMPISLDVECSAEGDANLLCSCHDYSGQRSLAVEGVGLENGCATASELCGRAPTEEVTCGAQNVEESACDAKCGHEIQTDSPDLRARLLDKNASAHCEIPSAGDDWYCSCANDAPFKSLYPVVSSSAVAETACLGAVSTCLLEGPFEAVGAAECSDVLHYDSPSSCMAGSDCMQPGVSGEYSVALRGFSLVANCQLTDAEHWQCFCSSITASEYFGVDAATSGDACTTAYKTCESSAHYVPMHDGSPIFVFTLPSPDAGVE